MPREYIVQFFLPRKPANVSIDDFEKILNDEYKERQQKQLAKLIAERNEKLRREKEEQNKREQEELKRKKEEDDRKCRDKEEQERREALERDRILQQQKDAEELDKKAAQQLAISAVSDLLGLDEDEEVKGPLSNVKQENTSDTESQAALRAKIYDVNKQDFELAKRNFDINRGIEAYLKEVGTLLVDPDVVYALHNIQELGCAMRTQKEQQPASSKNTALDNRNDNIEPPTGNSSARNLFPPKDILPLSQIKVETSEVASADDGTGVPLCSPPVGGKMFPGRKRHTQESVTDIVSSKKKRTGTPGRTSSTTPVGSPNRPTSSTENWIAQADARAKSADFGNTFLKKKKLTQANIAAVYNTISQHKREIVEYEETTQSFYKIMTHYFPNLAMIPEDVRHLELKRQLFTFAMKNIEYTKVKIIFILMEFVTSVIIRNAIYVTQRIFTCAAPEKF